MKKTILQILMLMLFFSIASAKRVYVEYQDNIHINGIEYRAAYEDGFLFHTAFIKATNLRNKETLWRKKVYSTLMNPFMEHDVQWVMIENIEYKPNSLLIVDEHKNQYKINLEPEKIEE